MIMSPQKFNFSEHKDNGFMILIKLCKVIILSLTLIKSWRGGLRLSEFAQMLSAEVGGRAKHKPLALHH